MSTILIVANNINLRAHLELAREYRCGLELGAFNNPEVLRSSWRSLLDEYRIMLDGFHGPFACHGAFFDMSSASEDQGIIELTRQRYLRNLDIAAELGAQHVVFHTNFLPMIRTEIYRRRWIERNIHFWNELGPEAARRNIWIAVENMWDPDPGILRSLMEGITVPNVGVCLDISHVYLYNNGHPIEQWIEALGPYIIHTHLNNTMGVVDEHMTLNAPGGIINYHTILPRLARLPRSPWLVLEMDDLQALRQSLNFAQTILGTDFTPSVQRPSTYLELHSGR